MHQARNHLSGLAGIDNVDGDAGDGCLTWTHSQLHNASLRVADGLHSLDAEPETVMMTLIPNRVEWALLLYANSICRLTLASLDYGALNPARNAELQNFVRTLKPTVVVVSNESDARTLDAVLLENGVEPRVNIILDINAEDSDSTSNWKTLSEVADCSNGEKEDLISQARKPDPDRINFICFTSGTSSGKPKGCPRHVAGTMITIDSQADLTQFDVDTRYLLGSANFRIVAPALTLSVWKRGGAAVMPGTTFNAKRTLEACEQHKISHLNFVPALLHALTNDESFSTDKVRSVRYTSFGGDIITKDLLLKARSAFPSARIAASHGMTEGGGLFDWVFSNTDIEAVPDYGGISTLGKVAPGSTLRIYDVENNCVVKRGELGEFQICSPSTIKHYLGRVHEDSFYEDEKGRWFKTGDIGMINDDGLVFILGRLNDRIKRSGVPITPAALESCIDKFIGAQVGLSDVTAASIDWQLTVLS